MVKQKTKFLAEFNLRNDGNRHAGTVLLELAKEQPAAFAEFIEDSFGVLVSLKQKCQNAASEYQKQRDVFEKLVRAADAAEQLRKKWINSYHWAVDAGELDDARVKAGKAKVAKIERDDLRGQAAAMSSQFKAAAAISEAIRMEYITIPEVLRSSLWAIERLAAEIYSETTNAAHTVDENRKYLELAAKIPVAMTV